MCVAGLAVAPAASFPLDVPVDLLHFAANWQFALLLLPFCRFFPVLLLGMCE